MICHGCIVIVVQSCVKRYTCSVPTLMAYCVSGHRQSVPKKLAAWWLFKAFSIQVITCMQVSLTLEKLSHQFWLILSLLWTGCNGRRRYTSEAIALDSIFGSATRVPWSSTQMKSGSKPVLVLGADRFELLQHLFFDINHFESFVTS